MAARLCRDAPPDRIPTASSATGWDTSGQGSLALMHLAGCGSVSLLRAGRVDCSCYAWQHGPSVLVRAVPASSAGRPGARMTYGPLLENRSVVPPVAIGFAITNAELKLEPVGTSPS